VHGLRCYGNNANPSYMLASIPRYDDIVRTLGGVCARCRPDVDWRVTGAFSNLRALYMGSGRGWLAGDWPSRGRSQHYCGDLDCGLPLVAFWQHNANAKC